VVPHCSPTASSRESDEIAQHTEILSGNVMLATTGQFDAPFVGASRVPRTTARRPSPTQASTLPFGELARQLTGSCARCKLAAGCLSV
jgi:hypothetical protein